MKRILVCVIVFFCVWASPATSSGKLEFEKSGERIPPGAVAAQIVGRLLIDASGEGQVVGYYTYLAGIPGPFFSGEPSEATAYFTFRSTRFRTQVIPNGNIVHLLSVPVDVAATEVRIYFNGQPNGNFQSPDTFSDGQLIGTLQAQGSLGTAAGSTYTMAGTFDLVSASNFIFQGQRHNFRKLGDAVTLSQTFGPPLSGSFSGGSVVVCFGGYALAAGGPR